MYAIKPGRNLLWQDAKVSLQTAKELGIKPSRPDLHPSVIIILTSSITCHPGSQYWSSVLLPRTSLGLLFPLQPFCISASDPGSFPFLWTAQSFFHYFVTGSCVLPALRSLPTGALDGLLIDRFCGKHAAFKRLHQGILYWSKAYTMVNNGVRGKVNREIYFIHTNQNDLLCRCELEKSLPFLWEQKETLCQTCCLVQTCKHSFLKGYIIWCKSTEANFCPIRKKITLW